MEERIKRDIKHRMIELDTSSGELSKIIGKTSQYLYNKFHRSLEDNGSLKFSNQVDFWSSLLCLHPKTLISSTVEIIRSPIPKNWRSMVKWSFSHKKPKTFKEMLDWDQNQRSL